MVTVKLKPIEELLQLLSGYKKIFIVGCQLGSGRCKNGGLREAFKVAGYLELNGFKVCGVKSPGGTCILEKIEGELVKEAERCSEAILSLACGAGSQLLAETARLPVITGVNTLFIGVERERKFFDEYCIACGECIISETGGICPVARCPKSLVNGPCGGAIAGKCEVEPDIPCVWYRIEKRLLETEGSLKSLEEVKKPKDYRASVYPRRLVLEE